MAWEQRAVTPVGRLVPRDELIAKRGQSVSATDVWDRLSPLVRAEVTDFIWHVWLRPLEPVDFEPGKLVLAAPSYIRGWVRERYVLLIETKAREMLGRDTTVTLVAT